MLPTYDLVMRKISHWNELTREYVVSSPENLFSSQTRCLNSFDRQKFLCSTEISGLNSMICNLWEFRQHYFVFSVKVLGIFLFPGFISDIDQMAPRNPFERSTHDLEQPGARVTGIRAKRKFPPHFGCWSRSEGQQTLKYR